MKTIRLAVAALAVAALGGCASYGYTVGSAPGGYYSGSPQYYGSDYGYYGSPYGGYGGYGSYGYYGSPYGYSGYPYGYGYGGGYYPSYPNHNHSRPPRPGDNGGSQPQNPPPNANNGGSGKPPWRDLDRLRRDREGRGPVPRTASAMPAGGNLEQRQPSAPRVQSQPRVQPQPRMSAPAVRSEGGFREARPRRNQEP